MNNRSYDIETLKAYLAGELDGKSMHALEKAALEDPFLADALEGLVSEGQRSVDGLSELQQLLHNRVPTVLKVETPQPVPLRPINRKYWWLAAAAMLLIGLGSLYIFTRQQPGGINADTNITQQVVQGAKESAAPNVAIKEDTLRASDDSSKTVVIAKKDKKELRTQTVLNPREHNKSMAASADIARAVPPNRVMLRGGNVPYWSADTGKGNSPAQTYANAIASASNVTLDDNVVKAAMAYKKSAQTLKSKNTKDDTDARDIHVNEVAYVAAKDRNVIAVVADSVKSAAGQISMQPLDKSVASTLSGRIAGMSSRQNEPSINDVVVVGYGQPSKKRIKVAAIKPTQVDNVNPVGGLVAFDQYVADQLQQLRLKGDITAQDTATVVLQFRVPASGRGKPESIKILHSAGRKLDKVAKKIVENGPDWTTDHITVGLRNATSSAYQGTYMFTFK